MTIRHIVSTAAGYWGAILGAVYIVLGALAGPEYIPPMVILAVGAVSANAIHWVDDRYGPMFKWKVFAVFMAPGIVPLLVLSAGLNISDNVYTLPVDTLNSMWAAYSVLSAYYLTSVLLAFAGPLFVWGMKRIVIVLALVIPRRWAERIAGNNAAA